MIFKHETINRVILVRGYRIPTDTSYSVSFMILENHASEAAECAGLIAREELSLSELTALFREANSVVSELGYDQWFMDVLPENIPFAQRLQPIRQEKVVSRLGLALTRFWYSSEEVKC